jgi:hypothetical protein
VSLGLVIIRALVTEQITGLQFASEMKEIAHAGQPASIILVPLELKGARTFDWTRACEGRMPPSKCEGPGFVRGLLLWRLSNMDRSWRRSGLAAGEICLCHHRQYQHRIKAPPDLLPQALCWLNHLDKPGDRCHCSSESSSPSPLSSRWCPAVVQAEVERF